MGYYVPEKPIILSPHNLGIPVHRPRAFIPCTLELLDYSQVNIITPKVSYNSNFILDYFQFQSRNDEDLKISDYEMNVLEMWDDFYKGIDLDIIGFPIWYDYFKIKRIKKHLPDWKKVFIQKNISFYERNSEFINQWEVKYDKLRWVNETHRKFEWQCGLDCKSIFDGLIQFRPSGVRVKRLNYFSTLVAMNQPQIIGPLKRRLHVDEVKLLQSFPIDFQLHQTRSIALRQLGNAVNIDVVQYLLQHLLQK
jgi:DNA (cytosine-5)-methyltransferase 1